MNKSHECLNSNFNTNTTVTEYIYCDVPVLTPMSSPGVLENPVKLWCIADQKTGVCNFSTFRALHDTTMIELPLCTGADTDRNRCFSDRPPKIGTPIDILNSLDFKVT